MLPRTSLYKHLLCPWNEASLHIFQVKTVISCMSTLLQRIYDTIVFSLPPSPSQLQTPFTITACLSVCLSACLPACLPDSPDLTHSSPILFWKSACEQAGSRDFAVVGA